MEKIEKNFVTISDPGKIGLEIGRLEYKEKQLRNYTDSVLCDCRRIELQFLSELINKKGRVDFSLFAGKIEFLIESKAADKIATFQKGLINEFTGKYLSAPEANNIEKKVIDFIRENYSESFSQYAFVNLYDLGDFIGSIYETCDSDDSNISIRQRYSGKTYAKGMIEIRDFLAKLKALGYVEGVNTNDSSISTPVEFLEKSLKEGASSYFGFQTPYTGKATYGKRKGRRG